MKLKGIVVIAEVKEKEVCEKSAAPAGSVATCAVTSVMGYGSNDNKNDDVEVPTTGAVPG